LAGSALFWVAAHPNPTASTSAKRTGNQKVLLKVITALPPFPLFSMGLKTEQTLPFH
jgi:hypothetical protein